MKRFLLIHYSEIGLKKGNIRYFAEKLTKRIKEKLEGEFKVNFSVRHILGRIIVILPNDFSEEKYSDVVGKISGIKNFKFVFKGSTNLKKLSKEIYKNLPKKGRGKTFCVRAKRSMLLPYSSVYAEAEIGSLLMDFGLKMKVKLKNPDFVVDVEFFSDYGFFSFKKYAGDGGMPPNSQGKLISLLSAGIDSPVAAFRMMRRGARIIFVHFHALPYTDEEEISHVKEIVRILGDYQFSTKLYLVPFGQIQKKISTNLNVSGKYRVVLYRRMMVRIAEKIAKKEKAKGIVTGDSFGQVASQTPENMFVIHEATTIPVYQPLIGYDKDEIIKISEKIGTFEISKLPCKDTCRMFTPEHPILKANVFDVHKYEKSLPIEKWTEEALKKAEIVNF